MVFQANLPLFARVTNTLAKEKEIEDRWRKLPTPQAGRHLANDVEPEVVAALRDAVVAAYPRLSHRYYALKAKWLGVDKLQVWDRNAPLPRDEDRSIAWDEARATVLDAYGGFDPRMADARAALLRARLDRRAGPSRQGAGRLRASDGDRRAPLRAAELPRQAARRDDAGARARPRRAPAARRRAQGELLSSTPLTLAETASVFGEMLTFQQLLAAAPDRAARKILLACEDRGHDQHRGAADRLLRLREQAPRRAARRAS